MKAATGKRHRAILKEVEPGKVYEIQEAVALLKKNATAKFDESFDIAVNLAKAPTQPEQMIRTTISLPNGTGRKVKVVVFAKGEKEKEATEGGADAVGAEDLIEKIKGGWMDFDVLISSPDMMASVGKLGKILGQKGLMPNPKSGTVTPNIAKAVKEFKSGRIEFRADKNGVLHLKIGKVSFGEEDLLNNFKTIIKAVNGVKPSSIKGVYIKSVTLSSTMGPGIKVDQKKLTA